MKSVYKKPEKEQEHSLPSNSDAHEALSPQLPNSCVMRIMQEHDAEAEADKLSAGVASSSPDMVRREMGDRLGADFSGVRFHNDSASISRSRSMGARAWTQGSDVYFGRGGFDPAVAAHELVHTVQQGAVRGNVSQSMPLGAVQMWEEDEDQINQDGNQQQPQQAGVDPLEGQILASFQTEFGRRCYQEIEGKLKDMIKKGAGRRISDYSQEKGIRFLVEGTKRIYTAKPILEQIASSPLGNKKEMKQRAKEYKGYFKFLTTQLGQFSLEEVAAETHLFTGPAKFDHTRSSKDTRTKRAYEQENRVGKDDAFNPQNDPELSQIQQQIDDAPDAKAAYKVFVTWSGNASGKLKDSYNSLRQLDDRLLKNKLKHMARVILDYPELRSQIGNMNTISSTMKDKKTGKKVKNTEIMGTQGVLGGRQKAPISYNAFMDKRGEKEDEERRLDEFDDRWHNKLMAPRAYAGTHELGHVLTSTLEDPENETEARIQHKYSLISDKFLQNATGWNGFKNSKMSYEDVSNQKYKEIELNSGRTIRTLDTRANAWHKNKHTSYYGSDSASEFFAEAVSDVYAHGKEAKPLSIALVKEYEKKQQEETKKRFFAEQNKPGLLDRLLSMFKFW